jgi:hypothetical protein
LASAELAPAANLASESSKLCGDDIVVVIGEHAAGVGRSDWGRRQFVVLPELPFLFILQMLTTGGL